MSGVVIRPAAWARNASGRDEMELRRRESMAAWSVHPKNPFGGIRTLREIFETDPEGGPHAA